MSDLSSSEKLRLLEAHVRSQLALNEGGHLTEKARLLLSEPANPKISPEILPIWLQVFHRLLVDPAVSEAAKEAAVWTIFEAAKWFEPGSPQRASLDSLADFFERAMEINEDLRQLIGGFCFAALRGAARVESTRGADREESIRVAATLGRIESTLRTELHTTAPSQFVEVKVGSSGF